MNIPLNGTFWVQAIHFYIAYCIINQLLFKPAVASLMQERAIEEEVAALIAHERASVEQIRSAMHNESHQERLDLLTQVPRQASTFIQYPSPPLQVFHWEEKESVIATLATDLAQRIKDCA